MENSLIKNLKILMDRANDTTYSLADKCGISQPTINRILTGKHESSSYLTIQKIAAAYGVNTSQLLGEEPLEFDSDTGEPVETFRTSDKKRKLIYKMTASATQQQLDKYMKIADIVDEYKNETQKISNGNNKD